MTVKQKFHEHCKPTFETRITGSPTVRKGQIPKKLDHSNVIILFTIKQKPQT